MVTKLTFVCLSVVALGCTGGSRGGGGTTFCPPGAQNACFCESGESGQQFCNEEGSAFSACLCGALPGDAGMDSAIDVSVDAPIDVAMDTSVDTGGDDAPTGDDASTSVFGERHYVIQVLELPGPDAFPMPGFDLDGTDAPVCENLDFDRGVDNQMANLGTILESFLMEGELNAVVAEAIATGGELLLLDMEDTWAGQITITWRRGLIPSGAGVLLDAGRLVPGQTFDIDSSVAPVAGTGTFDGTTVNTSTDPALSLLVVGLEGVPVRRSRFAATFSLDGESLTGSLGGAINMEELITGLADMTPPELTVDLARTFLEPNGDLDDTGTGCESMSAGWSVTAVPYVPGAVR